MRFVAEPDHIYLMDCREGMKGIKPKSVDLVVTDPPYGIGLKGRKANYHRVAERVIDAYTEVPSSSYRQFTFEWMSLATAALKDSGSMFVFSGWNHLLDILQASEGLGLTMVNHIIWKYQFGVVCSRRFVTSHYHCLYFCKNDRKRKFDCSARFSASARDTRGRSRRYKDLEDVWVINREYWHGDIKTPTKLPRELVSKILMYTSDPGDLVLDPFLGSGQVVWIAQDLECHYLGFEVESRIFEFATKRLQSKKYRLDEM